MQRLFSNRPSPIILAAAVALALAAAPPARAQSGFTTIPGIPGYGSTAPNSVPVSPQYGDRIGHNSVLPAALSADGSTVAGTAQYLESRYDAWRQFSGCEPAIICFGWIQDKGGAQAFVWSGGAPTGLGYPSNVAGDVFGGNGLCGPSLCPVSIRESFATGISADGRIVVGYGRIGCIGRCVRPPELSQAFVWTAQDGLREIAGIGSMALGVSGDGRVVVGAQGSTYDYRIQYRWVSSAFAWTATSGLRLLTGADAGISVARAASFDGRWIAGELAPLRPDGSYNTTHATLWGPDGVALDLGAVGSSASSFANDISFDGQVVVGYGLDGAPTNPLAFRWTRSTGMVALGTVAGQSASLATAVSGDGRVIVGNSGYSGTPFRWTDATGMASMAAWLGGGGVALPTGIELFTATDTNYNGNVVIGTYRRTDLAGLPNDYGYLARVGDGGSGFIADLDAFRSGIAESALRTLDVAALQTSLAMGTARRYGGWNAMAQADRRGCGWVSASRSRYRDGGPDADTQELGGCIEAGPVRLAAGAGRLQVEQAWSLGGRGTLDGHYGLVGLAMPLGNRIEASLTGYKGRFDGTSERRYANGSNTDASLAKPNGDFKAAVARIDWTDALRRGRVGLSPYLLYAWSRTDVDAYSETGGGFPVAHDASSVPMRDIAAGVTADFHLRDATVLGVGIESSRRRVDTGDGIGARVIGLFDASMPGAEADDVVSHAQFGLRHAFTNGLGVRAHVRTALDNEERDIAIGVQLHATF